MIQAEARGATMCLNEARFGHLSRMAFAACLGAVTATPGAAWGQSVRPYLESQTAQAIERAALQCAAGKGFPAAVAIFDDSGRLLAYAHSDGASTGSGEVAIWKGRSAAQYRFSTRETAAWNVPGAPGIATVPGGLPLLSKDGQPLGGVGISGGPATSDEACAAAGVAAAGLRTVPLR
jgi:glc operon protein GlcG